MTDLEGLVSMAQTAMRVRGQWCVEGIDDTLRRDIRAMVGDCAKLLRLSSDYSETLQGMAVRELERRAADCEQDRSGLTPENYIDQWERNASGRP
jgi:hypothetical protein